MTVRCLGSARPILTAFFVLAQACASQAACFGPGTHLTPQEIAKLQVNPRGLFVNAQGGPLSEAEIVSKVRDLVTGDKAVLKPILEALKFASSEEKSAIGTALGQAAQACLTTDAGYSAEIQEGLATTTDQAAILAFAAVTGNVPIGATGGGGAGGGAGGSSTGSGPSSGSGLAATAGGGGATPSITFNASALASPGLTTLTFTTTGPTTGETNVVSSALTSVSP
jgi:hypothetical protein